MTNQKIVVVQRIETLWTRASRGGLAAVQRNAVPDVVRLPQSVVHKTELFLVHHQVCYDERNGFAIPNSETVNENPVLRPFAIGCVEIGEWWEESVDKQLYATFEYNRQQGGAPDRSWIKKTMLLKADEWGQIVYNGRFPREEGEWYYKKTVVNVALVPAPLTNTSTFTRNEPTTRFEAMGHLF